MSSPVAVGDADARQPLPQRQLEDTGEASLKPAQAKHAHVWQQQVRFPGLRNPRCDGCREEIPNGIMLLNNAGKHHLTMDQMRSIQTAGAPMVVLLRNQQGCFVTT